MADKGNGINEIAADPALLQQYIVQQEPFILSCAIKCAGGYISKSDDEWSIALEGFVKAMNLYDENRGDFKSFAGVVIHNMLMDYYRQHNRTSVILPIEAIDEMPESYGEQAEISLEIQCLETILKSYDIKFEDLPSSSPKAKKTKKACAQAIRVLLDNKELTDALKEKKQLPMGRLSGQSGVSTKILDRHRKYIIAVAELMENEFEYLAEYAKAIWR